MKTIQIGQLEIDPVLNPAVLDTGCWNPQEAFAIVESVPEQFFRTVAQLDDVRPGCVEAGVEDPFGCEQLRLFPGSYACCGASRWYLAELCDHQRVLLEFGGRVDDLRISQQAHLRTFSDGSTVKVHPTEASVLARYFQHINPEKGPRPLGGIARMGIGVRHSVFMWPGALQAMHRGSFSANLIQNSVRELHRLETLTNGTPSEENYLFSFGRIQAGHTGSTFEGLWVAGVLAALASTTLPRYGADADHIQVKRGPGGLERARAYLDSARYYSFYTLDVSDILDYQTMWQFSCSAATGMLERHVSNAALRRDILAFHGRERWFHGRTYRLDEAEIGRLVGKYWQAFDAVEQMVAHLHVLKQGTAFDLEISIDETPPEVPTFNAITSESELLFLMLEIRRRDLPVTHLAPNFGIEKGVDYQGPDGLSGLGERLHRLYLIATELGFFLDCHSGDDLSRATRLTVGRATAGRVHFKVSPSLQVLFAETLHDLVPERFEFWWNDTIAWVRREAESGSAFAIDCLRAFDRSANPVPNPNHPLFEHYNFATVGRRQPDGSFENRQRFYDLPAEFSREIERRVADRLVSLGEDVFDHPPAR